MKTALTAMTALFCLLMLGVGIVHASDIESGIASYVDITGKSQDSDLVSYQKGIYQVSATPYDTFIYGVISQNPAVTFESASNGKSAQPVISSGVVQVRVTAENGVITKGDLLTSSGKPGLAMKATSSGYVIGPALNDFKPAKPTDIGVVPVNFHVYYFYASAPVFSRLFDVANLTTSAAYEQPLKVFKYVVSAIILIATLLLGFFSFGRMANTGIEALGRNPLAGRIIQFGIIVNAGITIVIVIAGFALAFLVIRL